MSQGAHQFLRSIGRFLFRSFMDSARSAPVSSVQMTIVSISRDSDANQALWTADFLSMILNSCLAITIMSVAEIT